MKHFVRNIAGRMIQKGIGWIYPRTCPICCRILTDQQKLVCKECMELLKPIQEPRCKKCGRPVEAEREYCPDCEKGRIFCEGRGIFIYDEKMKRAVLRYKYGGIRENGEFFARALCIYGRKEILRWKPDLIIPIPMHKRKLRQRGFNQAEDLAVRVGDAYGIPVAADAAEKVHATRAQKRLNAAGRKRNLKHAFRVNRPLNGSRILVIDDVFTTGSTVEALAECLLEQGAEAVFFLTAAIGIKKDFS